MQRCGLCTQPALTSWWLAAWKLERHLCGHHTRDREQPMLDAGWHLMADDREHVPA